MTINKEEILSKKGRVQKTQPLRKKSQNNFGEKTIMLKREESVLKEREKEGKNKNFFLKKQEK